MPNPIVRTEFRRIASPHDGATLVAVLTEGVDGYRCYEAMHMLATIAGTAKDVEEAKEEVAVWTRDWGTKLSRRDAERYFYISDEMVFAP